MGKKQSPFIGRRVPLVDNGVPILYPRYSLVADILVGGEKPDRYHFCSDDKKQPTSAADVVQQEAASQVDQPAAKKRKKDKQQAAEEQQPSAATAANGTAEHTNTSQQQAHLGQMEKKKLEQQHPQHHNGDAEPAMELSAQQLSKKEKKKLKQQKHSQAIEQQQQQPLHQEAKGNAEEAAHIRQVLGFTQQDTVQAAQPAQPAAAAVAAAANGSVAAKAGAFNFNFSNLSAEEAVAADTEVKLAAITAVTSADKDGFVPRRVFVGGMPFGYSQEQVEEYWSWCGEVEQLDIMTFPDTGRFRGIAFITFKTQEGADAALACNDELLDGQTLKVERCKAAAVAKSLKASAGAARSQQQQQSFRGRQQQFQQHLPAADGAAAAAADGPIKTPGYNVAYVGNIAFEARPEDISALFAACNVTKVRLHTDKDTHKSRGFAHVHFAEESGLEQAIAMSGTDFMGRAIKVSYGQPKKN